MHRIDARGRQQAAADHRLTTTLRWARRQQRWARWSARVSQLLAARARASRARLA